MKRALLLITLSLLVFITACQSKESKEVLADHNNLIDEIEERLEKNEKKLTEIEKAQEASVQGANDLAETDEAVELLAYHNAFIDEIVGKAEMIEGIYEEIDLVETDEEAIEIGNSDILPILAEMKVHMDSQNPELNETKEYHELRSKWFNLYSEIVEQELTSLDDYVNDVITEEELDEVLEGLHIKTEEMGEWVTKAENRIEELSDKYGFEDIRE